ncbi:amidohydrolase family protein [Nitriliruptoraceae bacterium ZYF776]|nr:amidohydrolase family protein [Profundirhabdus halotolerans]
MTGAVLVRGTRTLDGAHVDVRLRPGAPLRVAAHLPVTEDDRLVDGTGTTLLPGLHDHHLHLLALAAARTSVRCGPPDVHGEDGLRAVLAAASTDATGWVRGVGYHEDVAGPLDRHRLDAIAGDRPIRIQHTSGALWIVNTVGLRALGLHPTGEAGPATGGALPDGVELRAGVPTGRLWRLDRWLRQRSPAAPPDLAPVVAELLGHGVTGVTDATPDLSADARDLLVAEVASGPTGLRLHLLGADPPGQPGPPWRSGRVTVGPAKLVLGDHRLPDLDELVTALARARARPWSGAGPRPVAVHCVTRVALVLLVTALGEVGVVAGDRVEHGAVVPPELAAHLAGLGAAVVTQPGFLAERGDRYLRQVDPADLAHLYPDASLRRAGVTVAVSSDAPYASVDPWRTIAAAVARTAPSGHRFGQHEAVTARTALEDHLRPADDLGGPLREVRDGAPADVCLVAGSPVRTEPRAEGPVLLTAVAGHVVHDRASLRGRGS